MGMSGSLPMKHVRSMRGISSCSSVSRLKDLPEELQLDKALKIVDTLGQRGLQATAHTLYNLLQGCIRRKDLAAGRRLQSLLFKQKFNSKVLYLVPSLIQLFASCGSLPEADHVFRQVPQPNTRTWQTIISAHSRYGQGKEALRLFEEMQQAGVEPNALLYAAILNACASTGALQAGRAIHEQMKRRGSEFSVHVGNTLVGMYVKSNCLNEARAVFDGLHTKNIVSWTTLIGGYAQQGNGQEALDLFWQVEQQGMHPDKVTYVAILKACGSIGALDQGRQVHAQTIASGVDMDLHVQTTLVDMYAKCNSTDEARKVFDEMASKSVVVWSAMIAGYSEHGNGQEALHLFEQMQQQGIKPNVITFLSILKACGSVAALEKGRQIHAQLVKFGFEFDMVVGTSIIDMYVKCGSLVDAQNVFDNLPEKDAVSWNRMMAGFAQHGRWQEALQLHKQMQEQGVEPTETTFLTLLSACSSLLALDQGKQIHADILNAGLQVNAVLGTSLIDMYVKCGSMDDARKVFAFLDVRTVVSWTIMIGGYVAHGQGQEALQLFAAMQREGVKPDKVTFVNVLRACADTAALTEGQMIHASVSESGYQTDIVLQSALVDMYAKCGSMCEARAVFDSSTERDVVFSSAMIGAYAERGQGQEALQLFLQMQRDGIEPSASTFSRVLQACASIADLTDGKAIHSQLTETGLDADGQIGSSLVKMYAKCGVVDDARKVFDTVLSPSRDVVLWNTMIAAYAQHGRALEALQLFQQMQQEGLKPSSVTFISVLTACSYAGRLDEGSRIFQMMSDEFGIIPSTEHYTCMVDILCRAGHLYEAKDFITNMPVEPDAVLWKTVLTGCRTQGNVELGRLCFDAVMRLDSVNSAAFVLMSNIYADAGRTEDEAHIRKRMMDAGIRKEPGRTWIDMDKDVHTFAAEDTDHPQRKLIYETLKALVHVVEPG